MRRLFFLFALVAPLSAQADEVEKIHVNPKLKGEFVEIRNGKRKETSQRSGIPDARVTEFKACLRAYRDAKEPAAKVDALKPFQSVNLAELNELEEAFRQVMMPPSDMMLAGQCRTDSYGANGEVRRYLALFPAKLAAHKLYPAWIRIGHPMNADRPNAEMEAQLRHFRHDLPNEPTFCFRSGILDDVRSWKVRNKDAGSKEVFELVLSRWHEFLNHLFRSYPIDPARVYLTGFSFDGVQSLSMGLHRPDRIAGVAALSSCVYPFQIYYRYPNASNCKILVYRGSLDHQYVGDGQHPADPYYVKAEAEFGQRLKRAAKQHEFKVWPGKTHAQVDEHARVGFEEVARFVRPAFPKEIARCFLDVSEAEMEWITVVRFEAPDKVFEVAEHDWHQGTRVSYDRIQAIASCPILQASVSGNKFFIKASHIKELDLYLSEAMIDSGEPIEVIANGEKVWRGKFVPSVKTLVQDYEQRRDLSRLFWQRVRVTLRG